MGKQSEFDVALDRIQKQSRIMLATLDKVLNFAKGGFEELAYEEAFKLVTNCENLALRARCLPCYAGHVDAVPKIDQTLVETIPVPMRFTPENWFEMTIPALLPKKKSGSAHYIFGFLYPALKAYFRENDLIRFPYPDYVIIFRHIYNRDRPERLYRDHDNIEINTVVNLVALYLQKGDGPLHCFHFYCSAAGDDDCTQVTVVPQSDFAKWIAQNNIGDEDTDMA